jgi:hypothetical protein
MSPHRYIELIAMVVVVVGLIPLALIVLVHVLALFGL